MMTGLWECRKIEEGRDGEERKKKKICSTTTYIQYRTNAVR